MDFFLFMCSLSTTAEFHCTFFASLGFLSLKQISVGGSTEGDGCASVTIDVDPAVDVDALAADSVIPRLISVFGGELAP